MTVEQASAFFLFALVAAVTPGPSNILLTSTGTNAGVIRGLPCLFGVTIGMAAMMFLVAFGAAVQRFLQTGRALRICNIAMGTLLAGSILLFIW